MSNTTAVPQNQTGLVSQASADSQLPESNAKQQPASPANPKMAKAQKRHRIASIDLEIAHLQHEKATLRSELSARD